jgi:cyclopropane-fatty-acyl-phospholipid synthase
LTLSKEQKSLTQELIKEARLEGHVWAHVLDYRDIPTEFEKVFDAFVNMEMRGKPFLSYPNKGRLMIDYQACQNTYFKLVDFSLKS